MILDNGLFLGCAHSWGMLIFECIQYIIPTIRTPLIDADQCRSNSSQSVFFWATYHVTSWWRSQELACCLAWRWRPCIFLRLWRHVRWPRSIERNFGSQNFDRHWALIEGVLHNISNETYQPTILGPQTPTSGTRSYCYITLKFISYVWKDCNLEHQSPSMDYPF